MARLLLIVLFLCNCILSADLKALIKQVEESALISISVKRIDGRPIFEHHSRRPMIPASNLKLISSAAILKTFGPAHRIETTFYWNGTELIIKGAGDPALSDRFYDQKFHIFHNLLKALKKQGIDKIHQLSADNALFADHTLPPDWETADKVYYYAPSLSPLSYNDNCIDLTTDGKSVSWFPFNTSYVTIVNRQTQGTRYKEHILKDGNTFTLYSAIPENVKKTESLAISQPAAYTLHVLRQFLNRQGISCGDTTVYNTKVDYSGFTPLFSHHSPPMKTLLKVVTCNSNNFFAEMLTRLAAGQNSQHHSSYALSLKFLNDYLVKAGLPRQQLTDSCGLSRTNRLSADFLTAFLISQHKDKPYKSILAESGTTPSLHVLDKQLTGRVKAKTGSMSGVYTLSGYLDDSITFSILINQSPATRTKLSQTAAAILSEITEWQYN